jgi:hypothetical protein
MSGGSSGAAAVPACRRDGDGRVLTETYLDLGNAPRRIYPRAGAGCTDSIGDTPKRPNRGEHRVWSPYPSRGRPRRRPGRDDGRGGGGGGWPAGRGPQGGRGGARPRGTAARPRLGARGGHPGRAGGARLAGRAERAAALDRARAGAGRAGPVPRGQAGHRAADRERLLLRLRRADPVPPGGPGQAREAHAGDRQVGPGVPAAAVRLGGAGARGARGGAVQAGTGRHQG